MSDNHERYSLLDTVAFYFDQAAMFTGQPTDYWTRLSNVIAFIVSSEPLS